MFSIFPKPRPSHRHDPTLTLRSQTGQSIAEFLGHETKLAAKNLPKILAKIKFGKVSQEQVKEAISFRYEVAHFFAALLCRLHTRIASRFSWDSIRNPMHHVSRVVFENWCDEVGYRTFSNRYSGLQQPHAKWRRQLLEWLGYDYAGWCKERSLKECYFDDTDLLEDFSRAKISLPAKELIGTGIELIENEAFLNAMVWFSYYEGRIARVDYPILLKGLRSCWPGDALLRQSAFNEDGTIAIAKHPAFHLLAHITNDELHERDFLSAVICLVDRQDHVVQVQDQLLKAKQDWNRYWWKVGDLVLSRSPN